MKFTLFSEQSINQALQRYLDRGQWSKAAEQYKKLIKLHPENTTLRLRLAEVCLKAGNKKDALEQYQIVAEDFVHQGNLDRAITIFRTMLNLDSSLIHIRIRLAEIYAGRGDMEEVWQQYMTAFKYLEEKKLVQQATELLERMAQLRFDDAKHMLQLAEIFLARNLQEQAVNQFLNVAEFYLQRAELKQALEFYRRVLDIEPYNREARIGLELVAKLLPQEEASQLAGLMNVPREEDGAGAAAGEAEEVTGEEEGLRAAAVREETEGEEAEMLAGIKEGRGREPLAEVKSISAEELEELLMREALPADSQESPEMHFNLGKLYREMSLLDAAIEEFLLAAKDPDRQLESFRMLEECYRLKGMTQQAQYYRQKVESLAAAS